MNRVVYSVAVVVYNPNSTGDSKTKATQLVRELHEAQPRLKVRLRATRYLGHADVIAYRTALLSRHALIVSVSGDGGYNEVINGALRAQALGKRVSVGLIPAGNANDHYNSVHRGDFVDRVRTGDEDRIDVFRLRSRAKGKSLLRYGHSYIGIGLTPQAGERLNAKRLNLWEEIKIVAHVVTHPRAVKILVDGEVHRYDSLILSNVSRMSKVIRIPEHTTSTDGVFDVSGLYDRNKLRLVSRLSREAVFGLHTDRQTDTFAFETLRPLPIQIDGEVIRLDAGVDVKIDLKPVALRCIV